MAKGTEAHLSLLQVGRMARCARYSYAPTRT